MNRILLILIVLPFFSLAQEKNPNQRFHKIHQEFCSSEFEIRANLQNESSINQFLKNSYNADFKLLAKRETRISSHYIFCQVVNDVKVYNSQVKLNVDNYGNVLSIFDLVYSQNLESSEFSNLKINDVGLSFLKYGEFEIEKVYFPQNGKLYPCNRIEYYHFDEYQEIIFNTENQIVLQRDLNKYAGDTTIQTKVFFPDPITSANVVYGAPYVDNNDNDVTEINAERIVVNLKLDSVGNKVAMNTDVVEIADFSAPFVVPVDFNFGKYEFTRSESEFEDINVYYHLNQFKQYVDSLGFTKILPNGIQADCHALNNQDQSQFTSGNPPRLSFGEGGVDDAEDVDVIVHEYMHAVSDDVAPFTNSGSERTAMDEGICDYFAASYSYSINQNNWKDVFNWDGFNEYWGGRTLNHSRVWPQDKTGGIYQDGDIVGAALAKIMEKIGREKTDEIVLQAMYSLAANMQLTDFSPLLFQADSLLNNGDNHIAICKSLKAHGLTSGCVVSVNEKIKSNVGFEILNDKIVIDSDQKFNIQIIDLLGRIILKDKFETHYNLNQVIENQLVIISIYNSDNQFTVKYLKQ